MLESRTLFLGLGPTKTGSTWLHEYLRGHPEFCASPLKELHFFSARFHARTPERFDRRIVSQIEELSAGGELRTSEQARNLLYFLAERLRMSDAPERYLESFRNRVTDDHLAFGEISPSYCALTAEGFAHIRSLFPRIKLLICLRDPLSRMDSTIRHMAKWGAPVTYDDFLSGNVAHKLTFHNVDYPHMLDTIYTAFDRSDVHIQFFENLFTQDAVDGITDFIGISRRTADFEVRLAHAPEVDAMRPEHREKLLHHLEPIYVECRKRFGDGIPESWVL